MFDKYIFLIFLFLSLLLFNLIAGLVNIYYMKRLRKEFGLLYLGGGKYIDENEKQ